MKNNQIYFPSLNGVRFFAAFLVIVDHLELFKSYFGFNTLWPESFSAHLGSLGVTIFFVLSGYLITFLLLTENKISGIKIKNFYFRRILRIWPLYYLIVIISFFIAPHIKFLDVPFYGEEIDVKFGLKLSLFSLLLANVAFVYLPTVAFANVLWSVAVEEQFYLIWPNVIKFFKNTVHALLALLFIYLIIKISVNLNLFQVKKFLPTGIDTFIDRTRISCMIIGGIGAYLVFQKKTLIIKWLYSKYTQKFCLLAFVVILLGIIDVPVYHLIKNELVSVFIVILLINMSTNIHSIISLENKFFNFLGRISYGIYVYHLFSVVIWIKVFTLFPPESTFQYYIWSGLLIIIVSLNTILISHISYKYFEKRILSLKKNYSTFISGDFVEIKTIKN